MLICSQALTSHQVTGSFQYDKINFLKFKKAHYGTR